MHQFVPHFILDRYAAGQRRGTLSAVGLFADVSGFSDMTDALMAHGQHGAEVLAGVMREAFAPLIQSVYEQGGFITTQAGDAFTALFPLADDYLAAQRALAAAMNIQKHAAAQSSFLTSYGKFAVSVKAGLAMGEVSWGIVSSKDGRRAAYYFQGSAVDGCAAAEHQAKAGEILMDTHLYHQVQDMITAEAVDDYFTLIGVETILPEPLPVNLLQPEVDLVVRFLPRELVIQTYGGEFRQVTHLFVSLPTVRTETQLEIFMQTLFELQDRYGGLLSRLDFGDKGSYLLLFWGVPVAYENDVERCLNFILDLQAQTSIPISAGITYQLAHAGFIGSDLSEEYTCFGRGVNLAARFMSAASRGEIWLDEGAAKRAKHHFELDFEGEKAFKGFSDKQKVYVLLERKRESGAFFVGKMVGRKVELNRLAEFVQPIFRGQYAGVLLVWGEAGIGKSRLVHEFQNSSSFGDEEVVWAICQTDEILRQSLNPFRYWLRGYFDQSIEQSDARNKRNFNRKLDKLIEASTDEELAAVLDHTRSFLGALLDLRWPDSLYEQLDAQGRYENTLIALSTLIKAESHRQPLVIFIEDAHLMDEDTKSFLPRLARALTAEERQSYPIAILATSRYEGKGLPLGDALAGEEVDLGGLSREDLSLLAEDLLGGPRAPPLLDLLTQRAEGNPFFAEQILRYLQEEGLLEEGDRGWTIREQDLQQSHLPADVRALLVARLDRLPQEVREVVQTAAVLGREFDMRLLARMLHGDETLPQKVSWAEQAAIWTALNELRYIFKHALLRDAAYSMQLRARRQHLHRLAAEALEKVYADDLRYRYGELAYHSEKAGLVEQARYYLPLAGDTARDAYQNSLAIEYYSRALKLTPASELEARYSLHYAREAIYDLQGERGEQQHELNALHSLALELEDTEKQAEAKIRHATYLTNLGDYREGSLMAEEAISLAQKAGLKKMAIGAHSAACDALYKQGDYEVAIQHGETGIALAREISARSVEGRILNMLGLVVLDQQNLTAAETFFEQSLTIHREIGELRNQAMPLNNLGMLSGFQGDYAAAQNYYKQSLAIAQEIGHRTGEGLVLGNLGWVTGVLGDFASARTYAEQMIRIGREVGSRLVEMYGLLQLSMYTGGVGEFTISLKYAEQGLELARETHDRSGEAWALTYQGHALLALKRVPEARAAYQGALDIRYELDQPVLATEPSAGLARVALEQNNLHAAQSQIASILTHLDSGGSLDGTDEPLRVYLTCYLVLQAAKDKRANPILELARNLLLVRADNIKDEATRITFLENIPYHREILEAWGRHQGKEEFT